MKQYDLIVIGAGITGLSAALAWLKLHAHQKNKVLIVERQPRIGGCVTTFTRKGYHFDTVQLMPDVTRLLNYFDIKLELKKFDGYYARIFLVDVHTKEVKRIEVPSGVEAFCSMLQERYPEDQKAIQAFFNYSSAMYNELFHLIVEPNIIQLFGLLIKCPHIIRNANKTFRQYMQVFGFKNQELIEIFDVFSAFSGMPAERCAALLTVSAMMTSLRGSWRTSKGFIELPYTFKREIEKYGGAIQTNTEVTKVLIKNRQAYGVKTANGDLFYSNNIVITTDTKIAMTQLVDFNQLYEIDKKYAQKVKEVKMSPSALTIHLGLNNGIYLKQLGFDCGYNVLTTGKGTFEKMFRAFDEGTTAFDTNNFHCAVICPSLKTGGKTSLVIRVVPMPIANWRLLRETDYQAYKQKKEEVGDFFIRLVERYMIPNLSQHIVYKDIATPATYQRYLNSPTGSNYDMSPYPNNFGKKRLKMRTPVKNLYLPKFSHGIWPSMQAGLQVVDMISNGKIMNGKARY